MNEEIKRMIDRMFGDTSVPAEDTRSNLSDIRDHVDVLIETIDETNGD